MHALRVTTAAVLLSSLTALAAAAAPVSADRSATPERNRVGAVELKLSDARAAQEGVDLDVVRRERGSYPDHVGYLDLALGPGASALSVLPAASEEPSASPIVLRRSDGRVVQRLGTTPAGRQTTYADLAGGYAVWKDTSSFDLEKDGWRLYARPLDGAGPAALLARAANADQPLARGGTVPSIDGDRVYFSSVAARAEAPEGRVDAYSARLDGRGGVRVEARDAQQVVAAGGRIVYATVTDGDFVVRSKNLRTRSTTVLLRGSAQGCARLGEVAVSDGPTRVAVSARCGELSKVFVLRSGTEVETVVSTRSTPAYLEGGRGFLWFGVLSRGSPQQFVLRTGPRPVLKRIGVGFLSGDATVAGPYAEYRRFASGSYVSTLVRLR